ncbi:leukocyte-associated immunoglobulin-like receptor 1 isoform X2 [Myotis daubentonii]|uniref:leukocyte-associated immunoglobulin-like receptor 1 isoform X2 n=1 Tax=Myotis daubentonii TaxID=98922 RepID=UPI002873A6FA|nr:leukocyte-associated immunoglobulin-like receptor 1 isoform X2 [Myotis daubentonii]
MSPRPSTLLGLVLCLGQTIHMQGLLPKPSLRAKPGPVVPRGRPVTFVCRGPAGAELFRLEKGEKQLRPDQKSVSQDGSQETEARFHIPAMSDDTVGSYRCLYEQKSGWSERSEPLQLQVTEEDSTPPSGLSSKYVYILVGTSVAFLLCLLLLVLLLVRRQRQRKHKSLHSKGEEQRPQERLNPAADITEGTPDEAAVCEPPEKNRETQSPSPDAGDAQEVTYAQLDPRALTLRAAQAVSPQPTEPTADSSTYAELPRR